MVFSSSVRGCPPSRLPFFEVTILKGQMFFIRCRHEAGSCVDYVSALPYRRRWHQKPSVGLAGMSNSPLRVKTVLEEVPSECFKELCVSHQESDRQYFHHAAKHCLDIGRFIVSQPGQDHAERLQKAVVSTFETSCQQRTSQHNKKWNRRRRYFSELFLVLYPTW